jgi:hypothetical protein
MPYNNDYNKKIARDNNYFVKRFIEHTDALGTSQTINYVNPSVRGGSNAVIGGGVGCADWHAASADKHVGGAHAKCPCGGDSSKPCNCSGGTNLGRRSKDPVGVSMRGGAILGLQDNTLVSSDIGSVPAKYNGLNYSLSAQTSSSAPPTKIKKKREQFGSLGKSLSANLSVDPPEMPSATSVRASAVKDRDSPLEAQSSAAAKRIIGQGHTKDQTSSPLKRGRGRPKKATGGNGFASGTHMDTGSGPATLGVKPSKTKALKGKGKEKITSESGDPILPTVTKETVKSIPKAVRTKRVVKSELPSSSLSGFGKVKKSNPRAEIVRKVMAEKGLKMIEASKYVKANNLY